MLKNLEKLKKIKLAYMVIFIVTCLSFFIRYFGLFSKIIKKFIDIYDFYDLLAYVIVFGVIALIILKSIINNIKDNILYGSFTELNDNLKAIKNNKSNDL